MKAATKSEIVPYLGPVAASQLSSRLALQYEKENQGVAQVRGIRGERALFGERPLVISPSGEMAKELERYGKQLLARLASYKETRDRRMAGRFIR